MGILKLTPGEFQDITYTPKELTLFWQNYFATLSINFSKLFCKYTREPISVRYLHRDTVKGKQYFDAVFEKSVIKVFQVAPDRGLGFLFLTDDLTNYFLNSILGSSDMNYGRSSLVTNTSYKLLENILDDMLALLHREFKKSHRGVLFEEIELDKIPFLSHSNEAQQMISVQQFLVVSGSYSFVFDIAFTNSLLETSVLL
jgi:hypothetical protein